METIQRSFPSEFIRDNFDLDYGKILSSWNQ